MSPWEQAMHSGKCTRLPLTYAAMGGTGEVAAPREEPMRVNSVLMGVRINASAALYKLRSGSEVGR